MQLRRHSGATRLRVSTSELGICGSAREQTSSMLTLARRLPRARPALRALGSRSMSLKYSKDHEWIKMDGDVGTVGISDHAQGQLGDVVYVDLPDVGATLAQDDTFGAVESVKAASDVYSPVSGEVVEVNEALNDDPSAVNTAAETDGWMVKIKLSDPGELDGLMDAAAYAKFAEDGN